MKSCLSHLGYFVSPAALFYFAWHVGDDNQASSRAMDLTETARVCFRPSSIEEGVVGRYIHSTWIRESKICHGDHDINSPGHRIKRVYNRHGFDDRERGGRKRELSHHMLLSTTIIARILLDAHHVYFFFFSPVHRRCWHFRIYPLRSCLSN